MAPERRFTLTAFDKAGLAVGWAALMGALLAVFKVAPSFGRLFADFGTQLPLLTQLSLKPGFWLLAALLPSAVVGEGILRNAGMRGRAVRLGVAVSLVLALGGLFWLGMYWPLFALSAAIQ